MARPAMDDAALGPGERVRDDERAGVLGVDDRFHLADLEARDDAVEDLLLGARQPAVSLEDGDAALQLAGDPLADRRAPRGDDRDRRELLEAVDDEVERARRGDVG